MSQQWHYTRAGKQLGPVSATELKRMASSGELAPNDLVWKEGMPNWVAAQKLTGLFIFSATPAPAPPPLPQSSAAATATPDGLPNCQLPREEQARDTQARSRGFLDEANARIRAAREKKALARSRAFLDRLLDLRPSKTGGIAFTVLGAALGGWAFTRLNSLEGQFHGWFGDSSYGEQTLLIGGCAIIFLIWGLTGMVHGKK